ncbi:receptor-like protein kinase FERONIA isoform X3 [Diospyros lotus]|uniref:receptor-like protein kinase FERONIA isoform X3 n=1 Tax=Diospyros lotus TaxID=55363 RepID=UPI0022532DC8|nr:receptor-like protein kinase FERONIA isoform X3 [Diospyros lotus]XP_052200099.1 receptor-like protein kinase FERONIA isoform X3 [Diospyros lotus]
MTAQISRSTFTYTFHVTPGQKFIRLHFYPTEYPGFKRSKAFFTVKGGPYTLLSNFSAALTADVLALPSFAKEFCVHVEDNQPLILTFSPSSEEAYAFVNGIEIVSIPTGLYHSREGDDPGVHVVGKKFRYPIFLDTSVALETVHRLNVGGSSILPIEDTGMFREWFEDNNYFLESRAMPVTTTIRINYAVIPTYSAPTRVYQTSWSMTRDMQEKERISFTWKLPVDQGFRYLVRFHFCELEYEIKEVGQMEFSIFIDSQIAEADADLIKWAGGNGIAVYRDYMVMMEGDRTEGKRDMTITLSPHRSHDDRGNMEHSADAILKGLEVFKLSNPDNSLAGVNMVPIAHALTSHNSKPQKLVLGCGIYTIANILISLLMILNVVVYPLAYLGQKSRQEDTLSSLPSEGPYCCFSLAQLQSATRNFDDGLVIGSGGFGNVYKGLLNGGTTTVAIKRMKPKSKQGPNEFWMEIETISKFRHKHLVSLLGYCDECDEKILVYEYMEQGTLAKHLYKKNTEENGNVCHLPWEQRLKICIGAARGLDYLHTGVQGGVIHRDVKTANILLNKDMVAKVSDFGLCKMGTTSHSISHVSTVVKGTFGYFDPHYFSTRNLTKKSDVYAFGVVLLEVLCGRPAVDLSLEEEQHSLSFWAQGCIKDGKLDEIIDPILRDQLPILSKSLDVFAEVARKCLHMRPNGRPTMADVVVSLEGALAYSEDDRYKDSSTMQDNEDVVNVDAADEDKENVLNLGGAEEKKNDEIIQLDDDALLAQVPYPSTPVQYTENIPLSKKRAQGKFSKVFHKISTALIPRTVDFGWINRGQLLHQTTFWHHTASCWTDKRTISAGNRQSMSTTSGSEPYPDGQVLRIPNIRAFSFSELRKATGNFTLDRLLGEGGFGKVYKGWLAEKTPLQNGRSSVIAVKVGNSHSVQGFNEWEREINILSRLSHPNVVKLLGYCRESERLLLVYEFMQNGSLDKHLFGRGPSFQLLPWETWLKILRGAIQGLAFLHSLEPQIIFRDFKSSNILLDASYNARITDFGLARLGRATIEETHVSTRIMGTYGYVAPEYLATGQLYAASDVYAVGVVMAEVLTGLKAVDPRRDQKILTDWIQPYFAGKRKFKSIMDSHLKGMYPVKVAWQIAQLSLKCLQPEPKRRPSMQQVVEILESIENPKEPR